MGLSYRLKTSYKAVCELGVLKKPMSYWYPGTNVVKRVLETYRSSLKPGDIVVFSDKALSIAYGSIYDESLLSINPLFKIATYFTSRVFWGRILARIFQPDTLRILRDTPLDILASHKRLALYVGGLKHFLKPVSEAGIDATNLPYSYVSLPLKNIGKVVRELREELIIKLGFPVNVMVVDSDKTFKIRGVDGIAFATRPTIVKGLVDLGVVAYLLGRCFPDVFVEYPTPVAYEGVWLGLKLLLRIAKRADEAQGYGAGRSIIEMLRSLGRGGFNEIRWSDLKSIKHYPVVITRIRWVS